MEPHPAGVGEAGKHRDPHRQPGVCIVEATEELLELRVSVGLGVLGLPGKVVGRVHVRAAGRVRPAGDHARVPRDHCQELVIRGLFGGGHDVADMAQRPTSFRRRAFHRQGLQRVSSGGGAATAQLPHGAGDAIECPAGPFGAAHRREDMDRRPRRHVREEQFQGAGFVIQELAALPCIEDQDDRALAHAGHERREGQGLVVRQGCDVQAPRPQVLLRHRQSLERLANEPGDRLRNGELPQLLEERADDSPDLRHQAVPVPLPEADGLLPQAAVAQPGLVKVRHGVQEMILPVLQLVVPDQVMLVLHEPARDLRQRERLAHLRAAGDRGESGPARARQQPLDIGLPPEQLFAVVPVCLGHGVPSSSRAAREAAGDDFSPTGARMSIPRSHARGRVRRVRAQYACPPRTPDSVLLSRLPDECVRPAAAGVRVGAEHGMPEHARDSHGTERPGGG